MICQAIYLIKYALSEKKSNVVALDKVEVKKKGFVTPFLLLVHHETPVRYFSNSQDLFISLTYVENS